MLELSAMFWITVSYGPEPQAGWTAIVIDEIEMVALLRTDIKD